MVKVTMTALRKWGIYRIGCRQKVQDQMRENHTVFVQLFTRNGTKLRGLVFMIFKIIYN